MSSTYYPWFALRVSSRSETLAADALRNRGFEVFAPFITERRLYADRFKNIDTPVFAGYVLVRWDGKAKNDILSAPAVQYFVSFGRGPVPIDDMEVSSIQRVINNGGEPVPFLSIGDRVRVETGVLAGVEGVYVRRSRGQLVVSVDLIEKSVALFVDEDQISPVSRVKNAPSSLLRTPVEGTHRLVNPTFLSR